MKRLKQLFCVHWFDSQPTYERDFSAGAIVCCEMKTWRETIEPRVCSKCGLKEDRRVGDLMFLGWG